MNIRVYLPLYHMDLFNYTCFYTSVYLQLYEKLYNYRNHVQLFEYLYFGILRNICVDVLFITLKWNYLVNF